MQEPLLTLTNRVSLFPILFNDIWELYKKHFKCFWAPDEIDLSSDINDYNNKLNDNERYYINNVLAFFGISDFIVNKNEKKNSIEIQCMEYNIYVDDKIARENVHSESYAILLETYVKDINLLNNLKNAVSTIPCIADKINWFDTFIDNGTWQQRMVASAITEGIFFSGSFCAIYWLKKRGLMSGLCQYNELISRDEGLHRDGNIYIYKHYVANKLPVNEVIDMIKSAVDIEIKFCIESLPVDLIGMNNQLMSQYIKFVADHLSLNLIDTTIYNVKNPFSWMNLISIETKTDFFSKRVNNYAKQSANEQLTLDDDY